MSEQKRRKELQEIAAQVVEEMDGQLYALQKAAEKISSGQELIVAVCDQLKKRGLAVDCVPDEDVIIYMPVVRADEGTRL